MADKVIDNTIVVQDTVYSVTGGIWQIGTDNSGNGTNNNQFYICDDAYRLTVQKGTGHIGIGTTNPYARLHIGVGTEIDQSSAASGFLLIGDIDQYNMTIDNNEIMARKGVEDSLLHLQREGGDIHIGGNVGIDTTAPKAKLHIRDGNVVTQAVAASGYLLLGDPAGVNIAIDVDQIMARTAGTEDGVLYLQKEGGEVHIGGNVVIGIEDQPARLTLIGNADISGNTTVGGDVGIGVIEPQGKLHIIDAVKSSDGDTIIIEEIEQNTSLRLGNHIDYAWMQTHVTKPLAINPLGNNVGIGTDAPQAKLHVTGGTAVQKQVASGYIIVGNGDGANIAVDGNTIMAKEGEADTALLHLQREGGDIHVGGNLGIGTPSPRTQLHILGGSAVAQSVETSGYLLLGDPAHANIVIDNTQIMARDAGTDSVLSLQKEGGDVHVGNNVVVAEKLLTKTLEVMEDSVLNGDLAVKKYIQLNKFLAGDASAHNSFGYAVALDRDRAVVGTYQYDDIGNGQFSNTGVAYVFIRQDGVWAQSHTLVADDSTDGDNFGYAVAIDNNVVIIGAHSKAGSDNAGAAYVFAYQGGAWSQLQKLLADDGIIGDDFGFSVAVLGDTAVISAPKKTITGKARAGAVYIFKQQEGIWVQQQILTASDAKDDDHFGYDVAISGNSLVIGARGSITGSNSKGATYVFVAQGGNWVEQQKLIANDAENGDNFGHAVAVSGDFIVIGALYEGSTDAGAAYVFMRQNGSWQQFQKLIADDAEDSDNFGCAVAIDGDTIIIGAKMEGENDINPGAVYIFTRKVDSVWKQQQKIVPNDSASGDNFGHTIAFDGETLFVGVKGKTPNDDGSISTPGAVYIFDNYCAFTVTGINAGIGTDSPQARLHIVGDTDDAYLLLGNEPGENLIVYDNEISARNNGDGSTLYLQRSGGDAYFGGDVGIGVTDPDGRFEIAGENALFKIGGTISDVNYLSTTDDLILNAGTGIFRLRKANYADLSQFTELVTILDNGNVGICTTEPREKLDVNGNTIISGHLVTDTIRVVYDASVGGDLTVDGDVGIGVTDPDGRLEIAGENALFKIGGTDSDVNYLSTNGDLILNAGTGIFRLRKANYADLSQFTELVTILDNGNVGICTTEPREKLDVNGNAIITGDLSTDTLSVINDASIGRDLTVGRDATVVGTLKVGKLDIDQIRWLNIFVDGKIGIDVDDPDGKLEISGIDIDSDILFKIGGTGGDVNHLSTNGDFIFNSQTGGFHLRKTAYDDLSNGTDLVTVLGNGYVGIGTETPREQLDVMGNIVIEGDALFNKNIDVNGSLHVATHAVIDGNSRVAGNALFDQSVLVRGDVTVEGNSIFNQSVDINGTLHVAEHIIVDGNSRVAGNALFDQNVLIKGDSTVNGSIFLDNAGGDKAIYTWGNTNDAWRIGVSSDTNITQELVTAESQYITYGSINGQGLVLGVYGGESSIEVHGADHTVYFRGNIGVGTTLPERKLHVIGDVLFDGDALFTKNIDVDGTLHVANHIVIDHNCRVAGSALFDQDVLIKGSMRVEGDSTFNRGVDIAGLWQAHADGFIDGSFGVGTTNPSAKLEVVGTTKLDGDATINGTLGINNSIILGGDVFKDSTIGLTWHEADPVGYGIHRTSGNWAGPNYQQLRFGWRAGIILDPGTEYSKSYIDIQGNGLRVTSGNVGIGTVTPSEKLDVAGNVKIQRELYVSEDAFFAKDVWFSPLLEGSNVNRQSPRVRLRINSRTAITDHRIANNYFEANSDQRLKKNIAPLENMLDRLLQLNSVSYQWNDRAIERMTVDVEKNIRAEKPSDNEQVWSQEKARIRKENAGTYKGFIAQELEAIFPEWVSEDEDGYKTINTNELPFILVAALKELKKEKDAEIRTKENEIIVLQAAIDMLVERVTQLEQRNK